MIKIYKCLTKYYFAISLCLFWKKCMKALFLCESFSLALIIDSLGLRFLSKLQKD